MLSRHHYLDLVNGRFAGTTAGDLETLFQRRAQDAHGNHLSVHFHGGLVSRETALRSAAEVLLPAYRAADTYPVFFVWNSDVLTTLTSDLGAVVQEPAFQRFVQRLIRFGLGFLYPTAGDRSAAGETTLPLPPPEEPEELERRLREIESKNLPRIPEGTDLTLGQQQAVEKALQEDLDLQEEVKQLVRTRATPLSVRGMADRLQQLGGQHVQGERAALSWAGLAMAGGEILAAVVSRYRRGRHHGLYDTVVQETLRKLTVDDLGNTVWSRMKAQTELGFGGNPAFDGGTAFVQRLAADWKPGQRVSLIGHSTGAIYIGRFLEYADRVLPEGAKLDVYLLAPACTFAFLHQRLALFRRRVRRLQVFGLLDARERSYWEVPVLSRGSLLYIVSGLFEGEADTPLLGMERYYSGKPPYADMDEVTQTLAYVAPESRVWAVTATNLPGVQSGALTHGGMTHEAKTLASLQHRLKEGV